MCVITKKTANFGKTRSHNAGKAGRGTEGAWSKKATAKSKKQEVNLRKIKVINEKGVTETIRVSMKAYKKLDKVRAASMKNIHLPTSMR